MSTGGLETICAVASGRGEAAVALIRLSGPTALEVIRGATRRTHFEARRMIQTRLCDPASGRVLDHVMVCVMPGPRSYTGEDVVEVFVHGGQLNVRAVLDLFGRMGARQAAPGEFTRRAFVNGRLDLTQAEAVAEVIAARSARALENAQALLAGALGRRVGALRARAITLTAELEAQLDFAEEVDAAAEGRGLAARHLKLAEEVRALVESYERGHQLNGVSVALVGRVNAGKSSLFNALQGAPRALVSAEAGTTRDYLEADLSWGGQPVTLVDTAGRRAHEEMSALERAGLALGSERAGRCDVVVGVVDLTAMNRGAGPDDLLVVDAQVVAASKSDLIEAAAAAAARAQLERASGRPVVLTSAETGEGLESLKGAVLRAIDPGDDAGLGETFQVTQSRQRDALREAQVALAGAAEALEAGIAPELVVEHTRAALEALGLVTGETYSEEVLDAVFSRFCIGK